MKYNIYNQSGTVKAAFEADSSCTHDHKVQTDNVLNLTFTLTDNIGLEVNDYILIGAERFTLMEPYQPEQKSTLEYAYNVKFYGAENIASKAIFVDTEYRPITQYYDTPAGQLAYIVACINRVVGSNVYSVGAVVSSAAIQVDYPEGCNCLEALTTLSAAVGTEWWLDVTSFNLTKCEFGTPIVLGYKQGLLSLSKEVGTSSDFYTRLIPFGSSKNIVPATYGHQTLQLPAGAKYVDMNADVFGVKEHYEAAAFSDIFPRFTGTVGTVRTEQRTIEGIERTIYFFTSPGIPFNPNDYTISETIKHVVFKSGDLMSQDFEANWYPESGEWELILQYPSETMQLPGGNVIPRTGDTYTVYNLNMPAEYYPLAEAEFQAAVEALLADHAVDYSVYKAPTDHVYLEKNNIHLAIGQRVKLMSDVYFPTGYRDSRITRVVRKLSDLNDMDIEISNQIIKTSYSQLKEDVSSIQTTLSQRLSDEIINIIKSYQAADLTDDNVLSSLRVLREIAKHAISREVADTAQGLITFLKGARYGTWSQGSSGAAIYQDVDGNWHFEADFMNIRKKLTATEIEILKMSHIGGALMLTGASMRCIRVEETADAYRCYMRLEDADGRKIYNQWKVGDQAFVETFNLTRQADGTLGNHYLWRLVTAVGADYIDLSKTIAAAGSDIPLVDDDIVLLGYQGTDDPDRQNATIIAGAGVGSPFLKQYTGINSFTLPEEETRLKPGDNKVTGRLHIKRGSTGYDNIEGLTDKFNSLVTGAVNLLLNTGFTGDYQPIPINHDTIIMNDTQLYSERTKNWTVSGVTIQEDIDSASGYSAVIGLLAQSVALTDGENYILSFKAKGTSLNAVCGSLNETVPVTAEYQRFIFKFNAAQAVSVVFNGTATICEIMLERGVIASEWRASYLDNDKSFAEFKAYQYLMSSIRNGSTDVIGGLVLTNMLQVGNYKDGVLEKVTGGKSGIYNDDNDVSDWGGGTYRQAIYTVMKYLDDPTYQPTETELAMMCKWVATHGGRFILNDAIVRGIVYADGGVFRGGVYAKYGEFSGFIKTSYQTWPVGETVIDLSKGAHWIVRPESAGLILYLPPASPANEGTDVRLFNSFTLTRSSYEFVLRIQDSETFFYPKFEPIIDTHYKAVIVKSQEIILRSISNQWYIVNYKDFVSTDFLTT